MQSVAGEHQRAAACKILFEQAGVIAGTGVLGSGGTLRACSRGTGLLRRGLGHLCNGILFVVIEEILW